MNAFGASFSRLLPRGTIVVAASATLGYTQILGVEGCAHDGWLILQNLPELDRDYAYYALKTLERHFYNSGAAIQNINTEILRQTLIPYPPIQVQRGIGSILSAYDDLMEANERRIAVMEEMARRLFEEWFVRFRVPERVSDRLVSHVEGLLPKGWEWKPLEAICTRPDGIQTGPFGSQLHQSDYTSEGVPVVMPKNLLGLRVVEDGIARIPKALANELGRHRMQIGDIVYGRRGDIGRRAFISAREQGWFCGTGCLRLRPNPSLVVPTYLFDALGMPITEGAIKGRAQGVTMPNLSAGVMASVPVIVPPVELQRAYDRHVKPLSELKANLNEANATLAASRDLLLPRLVSGELSVAFAERELQDAA